MYMKSLPVVLQVYTVREDAERDLAGTMAKVKALGYDYVELAGLYDLAPQDFKKVLEDAGIMAISAHVPIAELMNDAVNTVAAYATIGCKYIAIPYLEEAYRPGNKGFDTVMEAIPAIGKECSKYGITLLYHNHDFEFVKMPDGRYALDYMYDVIPADILQTEIDCCWVRVSGVNPADYVRKYTGRCPIVHLKDYIKDGEVANMYELIGIDNDNEQKSAGHFEFKPVGYGVQDIPSILEAAVEAGASYVVVEQDMSLERSALEAAKMSREYLRSKGF